MADSKVKSSAPRVSVITPVHNQAELLSRALDSVLRQRYRNWEAIVVDDASNDESFEVAEAYARMHPGRIRALRLPQNRGPAVARNRGVEASGGSELLALLDADDRWLETYLERQITAYDAARSGGRRPGICACSAFIETEDGIVGTFDELFCWSNEVTYDQMLERSYVMISALLPRNAFDEVGGFSAECWGTEDYDLWLRIMEAGYEVVTTREPLAVYRHHQGGLSKDPLKAADAQIVAYRRALARDQMTSRQRWQARMQLRHYRALQKRALVQRAIADRRPMTAAAAAALAVPLGMMAFLQTPSRWGEWLGALFGRRADRRKK